MNTKTARDKPSPDRSALLLYQGHESMRIATSEGKVIYVDPFAGEGYDVPGRIILRPGEELVLE